jgi:hypothetical protein
MLRNLVFVVSFALILVLSTIASVASDGWCTAASAPSARPGDRAQERGIRFGRKPELTPERIAEIKSLRADGTTVPDIMRRVGLAMRACIARWGANFGILFPLIPWLQRGFSN